MKGGVIKRNTGAFIFSGKGSRCQLVWIPAASRGCVLERALTLRDSQFDGWFAAGRTAVRVCKGSTSDLLIGHGMLAARAFSSSLRSTFKSHRCKLEAIG